MPVLWAATEPRPSTAAAMRAFAHALIAALLFTQVDSAVDPLGELRRNGAIISWVLEFEVPDYTYEEGDEPQGPPLYVEAILDLENTTEQTTLSPSDVQRSGLFLKNKMLWHGEERTPDVDAKPENRQSSNVQRSEGFPLEMRTEYTETQEQLPATDYTGASTLLESKHTGDVQKRIESTDVHTEGRHRGDVQGKEDTLAQIGTGRTATGNRRSNAVLEGKQLGVARERLLSDFMTERSQGADASKSDGPVVHNEATDKQVLAAGARTSALLESKPSAAAQNTTEGPEVQIEKRLGNEEAVSPSFVDNGSETSQMKSAGGIHHVLEESKGTESSGNSSRREATDSRKGNVTSQGSDWSTTTEKARRSVLEERQMAPDEHQVTRGGGEASATTQASHVLSVRAKDLQGGSEVSNGSTSIGPQEGKENSTLSGKLRRTNQEKNDESKDSAGTIQVAIKPTVKEEQAATATEAGQLNRTGAPPNVKDRIFVAANLTEDSAIARGPQTSVTGRSLVPPAADQPQVDSSLESPARLTLTLEKEKEELLRSEAIPARAGD